MDEILNILNEILKYFRMGLRKYTQFAGQNSYLRSKWKAIHLKLFISKI